MTQIEKQLFALVDPRTFEGDPYEAAERAVLQAQGMMALAQRAAEGARLMARNAEMERQLVLTDTCDAQEFEDSVVARKYDTIIADAAEAQQTLGTLAKVAKYNPKARIGR